nr:FAD-binding protein [Polymorphobacter sp.]
MTTIRADTAAAVADAVREAYDAGRTLEVVGSGSRRGYGRPVDADTVLDVSGLSGIVDYDPAELVLTARPGTSIAEITALVAGSGQHLAFDPPDLAPLWGGAPGAGTLGGLLALGLGGSRRVSAGAPRDHFLGFAAVNGRGENFSAGGKVIKNVTGYDLPKLLAGSLGTLAVLTEVTIKVLPAPRAGTTLTWFGLDDRAAIAAMTRALNSPMVLQAAAHAPAAISRCAGEVRAATRLHLAGVPVAVAANAANLTDLLADFGQPEANDDNNAIWHDIGSVEPFTKGGEIVSRVVLPPSTAAAFTAALDPASDARWLYDWGGGLVWVILPDAEDGHAAMVRAALAMTAGADGHATLVRAPDAVRRAVAPFQPLAPALAALSDRVRQRFDPGGVLNPGRIWARH